MVSQLRQSHPSALRFSSCCSWHQQSTAGNPQLFVPLSHHQCFCVIHEISDLTQSLLPNIWDFLFVGLLTWREFLYFCSDGNRPSGWCFTHDFSDLLSDVSCMIKIVCNENEVSYITYCHGWILLFLNYYLKKPHFYHLGVKKSWNFFYNPGGGL